ncbi:estradiol 17-beta-dehydrogenase 8 [Ixodes scapularis]|uniref:estradiol 17-beta-dehydrogenase 8 n=1 Tax=Ixodes scapularis TaxID=6945 RepID=UPI001A9E4928|nr:estradiol 17-beta-dehydrogenase 8 [Ixodes scapularis]
MTESSKPFSGRVAVVTGGGSGIGRCVCRMLATGGASVVVADINLDSARDTVRTLPGPSQHQAFKLDVGCSESVKLLFELIESTCPAPASLVVNCAGINIPSTQLMDISEESFDDIIRINLKGTFLITRAAARAMVSGNVQHGTIVSISSMLTEVTRAGRSAYSASKAGVEALTKVVAKELASRGIRVNTVLPAFLDTPMGRTGHNCEEIENILAGIPMGRLCRPEEVAEVVVFLCLPENSFMTGAAVSVSGGVM